MTPHQHPLIREFVANAKRAGAAIYSGVTFAVASFGNGKRLEIRVDQPKPALPTDAHLETKRPPDL